METPGRAVSGRTVLNSLTEDRQPKSLLILNAIFLCFFLSLALMVVFLVLLTLLVIVLSPHKFLQQFLPSLSLVFLPSRREEIPMINFTKYKTGQAGCIDKVK